MKMKKTKTEPMPDGTVIQSPCTALALREWLTETSAMAEPVKNISKETRAFLKTAGQEAYGRQKGWEFTPTRFMILLGLLRTSSRGKVSTYADIWPYLMLLSMPDEAAMFIEVDLENDQFKGLPGLAEAHKKGVGKCTNTSSTSGSKASRASMLRRKKKRAKG